MRKKITRKTTCIHLYCYEEIKHSFQCCYSAFDIFSNKREKRTNSIKCEHPWKDSHATNEAKTLFHLEVSKYLDLNTDVAMQEDHEKNADFAPSLKKKAYSCGRSKTVETKPMCLGKKTLHNKR